MARPLTPSGAEVEVRYTQDGQKVENVLHFTKPTTWSASDLDSLGLDVISWWDGSMRSITSTGVALVEVVATDLSSASGPQVSNTTGLPISGLEGSDSMPNNVTAAVKLLTASRGRSFRGRAYVVGLTTDAITGNTLTTAAVATLKAAFEALRDFGFTIADTQFGVLSEVTGGSPRTTGIITPITTIAVDATTDSQRRRLPGRGQ